jgi:hypothetical protein
LRKSVTDFRGAVERKSQDFLKPQRGFRLPLKGRSRCLGDSLDRFASTPSEEMKAKVQLAAGELRGRRAFVSVRRHEVPTRRCVRHRRVVHHAARSNFNPGVRKRFSHPVFFNLGLYNTREACEQDRRSMLTDPVLGERMKEAKCAQVSIHQKTPLALPTQEPRL